MGEISNEQFIVELSKFLVGKKICSFDVKNGIDEFSDGITGWVESRYDGTQTITIEVRKELEGGE